MEEKQIGKAKCPRCKRSDKVGRVKSTKGRRCNSVTTMNYCRRCFIEFDSKGAIRPPLYK